MTAAQAVLTALALLIAPTAASAVSPAPPGPAGKNLLENGGFETVGEDGLPVAWSPLWPSSVNYFQIVGSDASEGARSLRVLDASPTAGAGLRADAAPVVPGETYEFSMDLNLDRGVLQPTVYFFDSSGSRLSQPWEVVEPQAGTWQREAVQFTAPAGAARAEPIIYSSSVGTVDGLVDDVAFRMAEPDEEPLPPRGTEEELGRPIKGSTNAGAGYTTDANGRKIGIFVGGGSPSEFSAVDILTGERLASRTLTNTIMAWSFVTAPDRSVYFGTQTGGEVWRFDPDLLSLELIASKPFGQTHLWSATLDDRGRPVFGTYPGGKVIAYDPGTGDWQDYGRQAEGNIYVRSLTADGHHIYAGGGSIRATLTRLDTTTGEITQIPLPAGHVSDTFTYDVSVAGDLLFARPTPSNELLVYSLTEQRWVDSVPEVVGLAVSPELSTRDSGTTRREALIVPIQGAVIAYDLDTREQRRISMGLGGAAARGWALMELGTDGFPGVSAVTATSKGVFHAWNPATGQTSAVGGDVVPTPYLIRSMTTGPGGDVFVGGYGSPPGIARVDADSGATEPLNGVGQTEGLVAHGDDLVFGSYPGARIYTYDTTKPWNPPSNPVTGAGALQLGEHQDRPIGWADAGDVVAIGSMPDYGLLDGALSLFNPSTGDLQVFRNVIADQTPLALAHRDGLIYGGTGIWGGIGVEPTTSEGKLFIFDPAAGKVVFETVPVPGAQNVSALTFDDEGNLWGFTANELFKFDPEQRKVVLTKKYFGVDDSKIYATGRELFWHQGELVGTSTGRMFRMDPRSLEMTVIQSGVANPAIDRNGSFYYNRGSMLYRWIPEKGPARPACDRTLTGQHANLVLEPGTTCLVDGEVAGRLHLGAGAGVVVERSVLGGGVTAEGADDAWLDDSYAFGHVSITGTRGTTVVSGTTVRGGLACSGNVEPPTDLDRPNTVRGEASGECTRL
ncbi:carbohydrate binding domain-containing protein [Streptomyces sp. NPDC054847]